MGKKNHHKKSSGKKRASQQDLIKQNTPESKNFSETKQEKKEIIVESTQGESGKCSSRQNKDSLLQEFIKYSEVFQDYSKTILLEYQQAQTLHQIILEGRFDEFIRKFSVWVNILSKFTDVITINEEDITTLTFIQNKIMQEFLYFYNPLGTYTIQLVQYLFSINDFYSTNCRLIVKYLHENKYKNVIENNYEVKLYSLFHILNYIKTNHQLLENCFTILLKSNTNIELNINMELNRNELNVSIKNYTILLEDFYENLEYYSENLKEIIKNDIQNKRINKENILRLYCMIETYVSHNKIYKCLLTDFYYIDFCYTIHYYFELIYSEFDEKTSKEVCCFLEENIRQLGISNVKFLEKIQRPDLLSIFYLKNYLIKSILTSLNPNFPVGIENFISNRILEAQKEILKNNTELFNILKKTEKIKDYMVLYKLYQEALSLTGFDTCLEIIIRIRMEDVSFNDLHEIITIQKDLKKYRYERILLSAKSIDRTIKLIKELSNSDKNHELEINIYYYSAYLIKIILKYLIILEKIILTIKNMKNISQDDYPPSDIFFLLEPIVEETEFFLFDLISDKDSGIFIPSEILNTFYNTKKIIKENIEKEPTKSQSNQTKKSDNIKTYKPTEPPTKKTTNRKKLVSKKNTIEYLESPEEIKDEYLDIEEEEAFSPTFDPTSSDRKNDKSEETRSSKLPTLNYSKIIKEAQNFTFEYKKEEEKVKDYFSKLSKTTFNEFINTLNILEQKQMFYEIMRYFSNKDNIVIKHLRFFHKLCLKLSLYNEGIVFFKSIVNDSLFKNEISIYLSYYFLKLKNLTEADNSFNDIVINELRSPELPYVIEYYIHTKKFKLAIDIIVSDISWNSKPWKIAILSSIYRKCGMNEEAFNAIQSYTCYHQNINLIVELFHIYYKKLIKKDNKKETFNMLKILIKNANKNFPDRLETITMTINFNTYKIKEKKINSEELSLFKESLLDYCDKFKNNKKFIFLAFKFLSFNFPDIAIGRIKDFLEKNGKTDNSIVFVEFEMLLAFSYYKNGNYHDSMNTFDSIMNQSLKNRMFYFYYYNTLIEVNDNEKIEVLIKKAEEHLSYDTQLLTHLKSKIEYPKNPTSFFYLSNEILSPPVTSFNLTQ